MPPRRSAPPRASAATPTASTCGRDRRTRSPASCPRARSSSACRCGADSGGRRGREELQPALPAVGGADRVAHRLPALAVAVEMAVLELDAGPLPALRDEAHLELAA